MSTLNSLFCGGSSSLILLDSTVFGCSILPATNIGWFFTDFYNYGGYNGGNGYGPGAEFYDDYYNYPDYYDYSTSHGGRGRGNDGRVRKSNNGNSQIHQQQNQIPKAKGQPSS